MLQLEPVMSPYLLEQLQQNTIWWRYCSACIYLLWSCQSHFIKTKPLKTATFSALTSHNNCLKVSFGQVSFIYLLRICHASLVYYFTTTRHTTIHFPIKKALLDLKFNRSSGKIQDTLQAFSPGISDWSQNFYFH